MKDSGRKKVYFENLDGLRFWCFFLVFLFHSFHSEYDHITSSEIYSLVAHQLFGNGNIGVNFFFVLSGFLITYLLHEEKDKTGSVHLRKFYLRRALRIWPLYYASLLFGFVAFPFIKGLLGEQPEETASLSYYLIFLSNFDYIKNGADASTLSVLWSIAVEEQFYVFWPLLISIFGIKRSWIPMLFVLLICFYFRYSLNDAKYHEYHTLSCIGDMAIGGIGAMLIRFNQVQSFFVKLPRFWILVIYLCFFGFLFFREVIYGASFVLMTFERSILATICLAIILEQVYSKNSLWKFGRSARITYLGRISYGLYVLHFVGILIATNFTKLLGWNTHLWQVIILETALALCLTITLSHFSFNYFEKPFLKLKYQFSSY